VLQQTLQDKERAEHTLQEENHLLKERIALLTTSPTTNTTNNNTATIPSQVSLFFFLVFSFSVYGEMIY
jgi:hypothetical protein